MKLPYAPIGRSYRNGFWSGAFVGNAAAVFFLRPASWFTVVALLFAAVVLDFRASLWEALVCDAPQPEPHEGGDAR
jgi:hypothetical protein